jgi:hypothetical protein
MGFDNLGFSILLLKPAFVSHQCDKWEVGGWYGISMALVWRWYGISILTTVISQ